MLRKKGCLDLKKDRFEIDFSIFFTSVLEQVEQEFPNRPYVSLRDAIQASDYEAVMPFLKSDRFSVTDRGDHSRT